MWCSPRCTAVRQSTTAALGGLDTGVAGPSVHICMYICRAAGRREWGRVACVHGQRGCGRVHRVCVHACTPAAGGSGSNSCRRAALRPTQMGPRPKSKSCVFNPRPATHLCSSPPLSRQSPWSLRPASLSSPAVRFLYSPSRLIKPSAPVPLPPSASRPRRDSRQEPIPERPVIFHPSHNADHQSVHSRGGAGHSGGRLAGGRPWHPGLRPAGEGQVGGMQSEQGSAAPKQHDVNDE